ncbi:hypothetical protein GUITHDRAFT_151498 [Guillardia theta CCMP2712]|uniref:Uncharacterized protein n=1 Tax=Guillardia theta (strain CCMP2712) TaxID=905079 RepID=L1JLA7_GUITC|nr:hypothetical protein GUITHDRAFT_151498 [Guillardia theta CCMP2712]EKX49291.1 hypothetical protein GUITHDRAFT_151498 [Guillardia theta CCMP2712]|mmetsp:Transcript_8458/g.28365  ORF Transcript_8458/g.28365 Transcript_8458/m.28365 type:complete len:94 (-) Transcript_8458:94-375(-)|eukprot:XP_005836271.1 hypothetical protein GUITHDRAFT_151498 [Guillardia theta CCMP2712]
MLEDLNSLLTHALFNHSQVQELDQKSQWVYQTQPEACLLQPLDDPFKRTEALWHDATPSEQSNEEKVFNTAASMSTNSTNQQGKKINSRNVNL